MALGKAEEIRKKKNGESDSEIDATDVGLRVGGEKLQGEEQI